MRLPGARHTIHGFPAWLVQHLSHRGRQRPLGILPTPYPLVEKPAPGFSQKTDVSIEVSSPAGAGRVEVGPTPGVEGGAQNVPSLSSKGLPGDHSRREAMAGAELVASLVLSPQRHVTSRPHCLKGSATNQT